MIDRKDSFVISMWIGDVSFYWNYETDELFDIYSIATDGQAKWTCVQQTIAADSQTSTIQPDTLFIKPSVLLGYDNRNQNNLQWGVVYNGTSPIREIPTNVFRSCFYLSDIHATVSATYYISDPKQYESYFPQNFSIVLQIDVSVVSDDRRQKSYVYNIFFYTTDLSQDKAEQQLDTPEHVFCPKRINSLQLPNDLPERFSFNQERILTTQNMTIKSESNVFDRISGFSRLDKWIQTANDSRLDRLIELDDFATGLRYQYDQRKQSCSVSSITEGETAVPVDMQPNLLGMVRRIPLMWSCVTGIF